VEFFIVVEEKERDSKENDDSKNRPELRVLINKAEEDDPLFSGRGSPAFMSPTEPAIKALKERYKESFAFVNGTEHRVHLFMIKVGLWALVWTFVFMGIDEKSRYALMKAALDKSYVALSGNDDPFLKDLDDAVKSALDRTRKMLEKHGLN